MKTKMLCYAALVGVAAMSATTTPATAQPATASQATLQLSYGVSEVVQLTHANVGENIIVNYIQNSDNAYGLDANQILYLKQQGVSDRVINTMLNQPKPAVAATSVATPAAPAPQPVIVSASTSTAVTSTASVAPTVTYVQAVPPTYYYYQPNYNLACAWFPPITFSFGWIWGGGGGWHGGGGGSGRHGGGGWHH